MTSRGGAIARGSAAAALATAVALCSHVLAGGAVPHVLGVVVPLALAVPACTLLARWRPALPRLGSSVAVSQLLFHTLFSLGAAPGGAGHLEHVRQTGHLGQLGLTAQGEALLTTTTTGAHTMPSSSMWLAHLVAAVVTTAALHRGEEVSRRLHVLALAVAAFLAPPAPVHIVRPGTDVRPAPAPRALPTSRLVELAQEISRRGPPSGLADSFA
ncbi:hypothetical protein AWH69_07685 [Janibacter melonis]|uniref:Uncharacterized protein n=1 Tax=Janibacter melonis TaxID=262209 RepID=A0A176QDY7_9MICO|nr:hypothetical protein [Janibacter melonis]OAB87894.1 hypothetical protein AWH69_07685 [Janibacter melonis]